MPQFVCDLLGLGLGYLLEHRFDKLALDVVNLDIQLVDLVFLKHGVE